MNKKIMIGCPVRNRAWILPRYLEALENIDYPQSLIEYTFIINDCTDSTAQILTEFARQKTSVVNLIIKNLGTNQRHERGLYSFSRLAELRNKLLLTFENSECNYLLSVDSDIIVPPQIIKTLISNNCDIVSALVCNGHHLGNTSLYNILKKTAKDKWQHITNFSRNGVFPVDCTGAAYLISKRVVKEYQVRYSAFYGAEDIGFCEDAQNKGLDIFCDGRIECTHIMN